MNSETIEPERLVDCLAAVSAANHSSCKESDIIDIRRQSGGLFNYVLRIETKNGIFFFKQYLDSAPSGIFSPPKIDPFERASLAYNVQKMAEENCIVVGKNIVPRIIYFDRQRSAFLMESALATKPLIMSLSNGVLPSVTVELLPKVLASLHLGTYKKYERNSDYSNELFRDFKLGLQYDGLVKFVDQREAVKILELKSAYQKKQNCVTHGDINSRNIFTDDGHLSVIDYEQSHLGCPSYDLGYILSEIFISMEYHGKGQEFENTFNGFMDRYFDVFPGQMRSEIEHDTIQHMAVQALYRIYGPSKASWTFYVDDEQKEKIVQRAKDILNEKDALSGHQN